jgi:hypothetical protein
MALENKSENNRHHQRNGHRRRLAALGGAPRHGAMAALALATSTTKNSGVKSVAETGRRASRRASGASNNGQRKALARAALATLAASKMGIELALA